MYPIKTWSKVFIPHENVAKYFGTPLCFTPPRYPALKMTGPLSAILLYPDVGGNPGFSRKSFVNGPLEARNIERLL